MRIPKIFHFVASGELSELEAVCIQSWRNHHPGWQALTWAEGDKDALLAQHGGVWVDLGVQCLGNIEGRIGGRAVFTAGPGDWLCGAVPGHDALRSATVVDFLAIARRAEPNAPPKLPCVTNISSDMPDALQVALTKLDTSQGQLHLLCPAGIGDFLWIWSKWHHIAKARDVTFWFPQGEQHRAGQYAALVGAQCGYLPGLSTTWVWGQPREITLPEIAHTGAIVTVQANRHLESGQHIRHWYPDLPWRYPQIQLPVADNCPTPFCLAFLGRRNYMGGNLSAVQWGRILHRVGRAVAPVRLIGAGGDVEFAREVETQYAVAAPHLYDRPLAEVLAAARRARFVFGVAGGPTIAAMCEGAPSYFAYPTHLPRMPGTWEPPGVKWGWCQVENLEAEITRVFQ